MITTDSIGSDNLAARSRGRRKREGEQEARAAPLRRGDRERSAMRLDDRTTDREPHSHAACLGRHEGIEDSADHIRADAAAGVFDADRNPAIAGHRGHGEPPRRLLDAVHRLDRVRNEIAKNLLQLGCVGQTRVGPQFSSASTFTRLLSLSMDVRFRNLMDHGIDLHLAPGGWRLPRKGP